MPVPLQQEPAPRAVEPVEHDVVSPHVETPTRQYASINAVPPLQEYSRQAGAIAAAAAPIVSLASPILRRMSLDGPGVTAPLTGARELAESPSRSLASTAGSAYREERSNAENLPFTYSGVFSPHGWHDGQSNGVPNGLIAPAVATAIRLAGKCVAEGSIVLHGHSGLHEVGSVPARSHMSSALCADGLSSDEDDSGSQGGDDSDSDSESYEGLAVDDINETYDHSLPEYVSNADPYTQRIYLDEEGITIHAQGMSYSSLGLWLYGLAGILSCGVVTLLCRWVPQWRIRWTMKRAPLGEADFAVIVDEFGAMSIEPIERRGYGGTLESIFGSLTRKGPLHRRSDDVVRNLSMFTHRYYRFVYHPYLEKFLPNTCWMDSAWTRLPATMRTGLTYDVRDLRSTIFGENNIDIKEKSIARILFDEVLNPFYVFQAGSVILWCFDNYYYYASCILLISASGIVETLVETRRNTRKIREMAHFTCPVRVLRDGTWRDGSAEELLPGDVFELVPSMHVLPCDAVLLEGDCIVNESMLTGESVPVAKVPVAPAVFGKMRLASSTFGSDIAKHVLFSGTKLVRVKKTSLGFGGSRWLDLEQRTALGTPARATAMVLRTGFNTTKGALIRSILFPRPNKFKFYDDSFRFIGVLAGIAVLGFLASIGNFLRLGLNARIITVRALDLIT
ncbi:hypothetical protein GGI00_003246, partial [Coemansia sp. RSA 2681]